MITRFLQKHITAWYREIFNVSMLEELARSNNKSIGQVVLRWILEHGYLPLPKSVTPSRIKENLSCLTLNLIKKNIEKIDNFTEHLVVRQIQILKIIKYL